MNVYDIYKDPEGNTHLLKSGFCWPGFILAWLWTAIRGMYGIALGQLACWFLFIAIGFSFWYNLNWLYLIQPLSDLSAVSSWVFTGFALGFWFLAFVVHLYCGVFCNLWRRNKIDAEGWVRKGNVMASSKKSARLKQRQDGQQSS
jgi:hypothetical protein